MLQNVALYKPEAVFRKKVPAKTVLNSFFVSVELITDVISIMKSVISSTETKKEFSTVLAGTFFLNTASGRQTNIFLVTLRCT